VSTDYYVRLEQGRERHPSVQMVDTLARALGLDEEATAHLHKLALPRSGRRRRPVVRRDIVSPRLLNMMAAWPQAPAVVLDSCLRVLAANDLGRALFDGHTYRDDLLRLVFLEPDARNFSPDWDRVAADTVAGLRAAAGTDYDDSHLVETVGEPSLTSEPFRRLWARHDIHHKT
jgi:hypothetical protein